jgi:hypothetical protein
VTDEPVMVNGVKVDGTPDSFADGARRNTKDGKGRYDLIPEQIWDVINRAIYRAYQPTDLPQVESYSDLHPGYLYACKSALLMCAYLTPTRESIMDLIINLVVDSSLSSNVDYDGIERMHDITFDDFIEEFNLMLEKLAKHYETGAQLYGVNNWKHGIPIMEAEKGGCFLDSMRRHLKQYINGEQDEPHMISCIWNALGILWTLDKQDSMEAVSE